MNKSPHSPYKRNSPVLLEAKENTTEDIHAYFAVESICAAPLK